MMSYGWQPQKHEVLRQGTYRHARPDQPESIAQLSVAALVVQPCDVELKRLEEGHLQQHS